MKTLTKILCLLFALFFYIQTFRLSFANSGPKFSGDGTIRFFNYHLNEWKEITFKKDGKFLKEGIAEVEHLLRSRDDASKIKIDLKLLDLIDHLQDHFNADTVEIISGYRRKEFNEKLLKTGHNVSPVSLHVEGRAMDIHLDEIREESLRDYVLSLKQGGVGYYKNLDFVHVDTGEVRYWEEAMGERKLVGVLNHDPDVVRLTSAQNDYSEKEASNGKLSLKWSGWKFRGTFDRYYIQNLKLERFWRGRWVSCNGGVRMIELKEQPMENQFATDVVVDLKNLRCEGPQNHFGKYRVRFEMLFASKIAYSSSSNEFYLKKE